ncbi:hypothetical protein DdX_16201 [Ditylenchus destructor]|uniref:Uncharacterized protein n=1 Tax=Ditylenchus destructor TaxID=166010 RepID=A0AAD4R034_9BILA|nr:hypothetical protein DdX_16201 [Ditylenchus destructor]
MSSNIFQKTAAMVRTRNMKQKLTEIGFESTGDDTNCDSDDDSIEYLGTQANIATGTISKRRKNYYLRHDNRGVSCAPNINLAAHDKTPKNYPDDQRGNAVQNGISPNSNKDSVETNTPVTLTLSVNDRNKRSGSSAPDICLARSRTLKDDMQDETNNNAQNGTSSNPNKELNSVKTDTPVTPRRSPRKSMANAKNETTSNLYNEHNNSVETNASLTLRQTRRSAANARNTILSYFDSLDSISTVQKTESPRNRKCSVETEDVTPDVSGVAQGSLKNTDATTPILPAEETSTRPTPIRPNPTSVRRRKLTEPTENRAKRVAGIDPQVIDVAEGSQCKTEVVIPPIFAADDRKTKSTPTNRQSDRHTQTYRVNILTQSPSRNASPVVPAQGRNSCKSAEVQTEQNLSECGAQTDEQTPVNVYGQSANETQRTVNSIGVQTERELSSEKMAQLLKLMHQDMWKKCHEVDRLIISERSFRRAIEKIETDFDIFRQSMEIKWLLELYDFAECINRHYQAQRNDTGPGGSQVNIKSDEETGADGNSIYGTEEYFKQLQKTGQSLKLQLGEFRRESGRELHKTLLNAEKEAFDLFWDSNKCISETSYMLQEAQRKKLSEYILSAIIFRPSRLVKGLESVDNSEP